MRKRLVWLASVSALTAVMLVGPPAIAKRAQSVEIGSFTGAYLAARVAEADNDLDSAITYYQRSLDFDPEDQQLQQSLMLALISTGRFDEALPYAGMLKTVPDVERFSRVALAVDATGATGAALAGATGADETGADAAGADAPTSLSIHSTRLPSLTSCPTWATSSATTPAAGDGTSMVALSPSRVSSG